MFARKRGSESTSRSSRPLGNEINQSISQGNGVAAEFLGGDLPPQLIEHLDHVGANKLRPFQQSCHSC